MCKLSDFGLARDMQTRSQYEMKSDVSKYTILIIIDSKIDTNEVGKNGVIDNKKQNIKMTCHVEFKIANRI